MYRTITIVLACLFAPTLIAATFTVNSTTDATDAAPGNGVCETAPGNGVCTLRAAIQEANALGGTNAITLPAGTYTLTIPGANEYASATGSLDVNSSLTITGAGSATTIVDGGGAAIADTTFQLGVNRSGNTITLSHFTIRNSGSIGVILWDPNAIVFDHMAFANNTKYGAILSYGTATIADSTFAGNVAQSSGGAINVQGSTMEIDRCTFSGNQAGSSGGALYVGAGTVNVNNSTFTGNQALQGGGIQSQGTINLRNVTVANNTATIDNAGGIGNFSGTFTIQNTIVASNSAPSQPDCGGNGAAIQSLGYNLIQDTTGCTISGTLTGNLTGSAAQLNALADNGGPTQTLLPKPSSPVIDAGDPAGCHDTSGALLTIDQRGVGRPIGTRCDIGAVEAATPVFAKGDVNGDGVLNAADVIYLLNFLFGGGPAPKGSADVNGDGKVTSSDVFYLVNYVFASGPAPA